MVLVDIFPKGQANLEDILDKKYLYRHCLIDGAIYKPDWSGAPLIINACKLDSRFSYYRITSGFHPDYNVDNDIIPAAKYGSQCK